MYMAGFKQWAVGDIGTIGVEHDASEWQGMASEVSVSVFHKSQKGLGEVS